LPSRTTSAAHDGALIGDGKMYVFTTRADTIMGVTFCAVAPEHPLATHAAQATPSWPPSSKNASKAAPPRPNWPLREKEGMPTGLTVTHPLTGEAVPLWVGNYVLMSYGDGAVMGVPAHDERDFAFALKYGLPILQVVHVDGEHYDYDRWHDWYADKQRGVTINSDSFSGLAYTGGGRCRGPRAAEKGPGREKDHLAPARLGHQPPALLGHADSHHPLRRPAARCPCPRKTCPWCCRRTWCPTAAATR
jgi:leucyl-tRNA synthetase